METEHTTNSYEETTHPCQCVALRASAVVGTVGTMCSAEVQASSVMVWAPYGGHLKVGHVCRTTIDPWKTETRNLMTACDSGASERRVYSAQIRFQRCAGAAALRRGTLVGDFEIMNKGVREDPPEGYLGGSQIGRAQQADKP